MSIEIDKKTFQKFVFISNALDDGWKIVKKNEKYVFTKKHENRTQIFQEKYLETFINSNCNISNFLLNNSNSNK